MFSASENAQSTMWTQEPEAIRQINWFEGFHIQNTMWTHMQGEKQNLHESAPFHRNSLVLDIGSWLPSFMHESSIGRILGRTWN